MSKQIMVDYLDIKTRQRTRMPLSEITGEMVPVSVDGNDGPAFVDPAELKSGEVRHPPLSGEVLETARAAWRVLAEVMGVPLEEWVEEFRRDRNPGREVQIWSQIALAYWELTDGKVIPLRKKKAIFDVLVRCSMSPPGLVAKPKGMSLQQATKVAQHYWNMAYRFPPSR